MAIFNRFLYVPELLSPVSSNVYHQLIFLVDLFDHYQIQSPLKFQWLNSQLQLMILYRIEP
jgi:hypothetical protein